MDDRVLDERFWTVSPLDFRYYGNDKKLFHRLYPYVSEDAYIKYQLKVEATLARMLAERGVCKKQYADEIVEACRKVTTEEVYKEEGRMGHIVRALVNCIQNKISREARPYVHLFATSNDITDTANALRFKDLTINVIMFDLLDLERLLVSYARQYADVPQIGRTHGKHAEPITFGFALATYVSRLLGRIQRIVDSAENLRGKFSGSVGAYNALSLLDPVDPALFEKQLLDKLHLKPSDGSISTQIVEPEYLADLAYSIVSCFSVLANLADDIRHLHRTEIAEVQQIYQVDDVGSSTMPHKVNPRNFEHVKSMWKAMMPRMVTIFMDQISEHQRDLTNSASGRFPIELFVAFDFSVLRLISAFEKIHVDFENMKRNIESSKDRIISEPMYILLAMNGIPNAYNRVRELVDESEKTRLPLTEVIRKHADVRPILEELNQSKLRVLEDPANYTGASKQRALAVASEAETIIEMILSRYLDGGLVTESTLDQLRETMRPSYELSSDGNQELATTAGQHGPHDFGNKNRTKFS